jgi:hypothetical protein
MLVFIDSFVNTSNVQTFVSAYWLLTRVHGYDIVRPIGSRSDAIFCKAKGAKEWRYEQGECL